MVSAALLVTMLGLQGAPPTPRPAFASPAETMKAAALSAERALFDRWQRDWVKTERLRAQSGTKMDSVCVVNRAQCINSWLRPRTNDAWCMFDYDSVPMYVSEHAWGVAPRLRYIASKHNIRQFVCPNWLPPDDFVVATPHGPDERLGIDGALDREQRPAIRDLRRSVIDLLTAATHRDPSDSVLVGQRVRLLVDQHMFDEALTAAKGCAADRGWCLLLAGYVYHIRGEFAHATEAFDDALATMSDAQRCTWSDLGMLVEHDARNTYERMNCAARDSINDRVWWLADPLWSEPGNDRRTEQFARELAIVLHAATGRDERYDWSVSAGGDALVEMVARYGWPSYAFVGDGVHDNHIHMAPIEIFHGLYMPAPPEAKHPPPRQIGGIKPTFEYSIGRVHVVPPWTMIENPFAIKAADWSVNAPGGEPERTMGWWPQEHYAPAHPLMEIMDQQTAYLRRQDTTFYAYSTNLARIDLNRNVGDSVQASFVTSTGPDSVEVVETRYAAALQRLVFSEPVPATRALVSVEVMWDAGGKAAARARFGIDPPPPLSSMPRGQLGISDPVLLLASTNTTELPNDADEAIPLMLGSTSLNAGTHALGVYWETYGFAPSDTVSVSVSVRPRLEVGLVKTLGVAAGVAANPNAPVSMAWSEPQPGHNTLTINGAVPVQMRSVILNIDALTPGLYSLDVMVSKPGKDPVHSTREFTVR